MEVAGQCCVCVCLSVWVCVCVCCLQASSNCCRQLRERPSRGPSYSSQCPLQGRPGDGGQVRALCQRLLGLSQPRTGLGSQRFYSSSLGWKIMSQLLSFPFGI